MISPNWDSCASHYEATRISQNLTASTLAIISPLPFIDYLYAHHLLHLHTRYIYLTPKLCLSAERRTIHTRTLLDPVSLGSSSCRHRIYSNIPRLETAMCLILLHMEHHTQFDVWLSCCRSLNRCPQTTPTWDIHTYYGHAGSMIIRVTSHWSPVWLVNHRWMMASRRVLSLSLKSDTNWTATNVPKH